MEPLKEVMRVSEAAKILGVRQGLVRRNLRLGIWRFGQCIPKSVTGKQQNEYIVYRSKLNRFLRKETV